MGARSWTLGVVLVASVTAACGRAPRPVYEYEPTETYTSTAGDPVPRRVPPPEPLAAPAPDASGSADASAPSEAEEAAASDPTAGTPEPAAPSEPAPGRWYKAKPW